MIHHYHKAMTSTSTIIMTSWSILTGHDDEQEVVDGPSCQSPKKVKIYGSHDMGMV
jgi:hypothetical protein